MSTRTRQSRSKALKVGSRVLFRIGLQERQGTIVEDRGHIGKAGRQLFRIRPADIAPSTDADSTFELPGDELTLAK